MAIIWSISARFNGSGGVKALSIAQLQARSRFAGAGIVGGNVATSYPIEATFAGSAGLNYHGIYTLRPDGGRLRFLEPIKFQGSSGLKLDAEWVGNDIINSGIFATAGSTLLYQSASGLEKAIADTEAYRLTATYAELIGDQWNPFRISYRNLPYLAWAQGVNLWEDWWGEAFKRQWVADQWTLKAERGSRLGLKKFVSAVGGTVKRVITPPAITYPGSKLTDEQRAAYVARFPQLRMYPYVARIMLPYIAYAGGKTRLGDGPFHRAKNGAYLGPVRPVYPTHQDQGGNYTRTATIWDRGVETTLTVRKIVKEVMGPGAGWGFTPGVSQYDEEVLLPTSERVFSYLGAGFGLSNNLFLGKQAALRTISISRSGPLDFTQGKAQYQTIIPDGELVRLLPEHVATVHPIRPTEVYLNYTFLKKCSIGPGIKLCPALPRSNAWQFLYDRWYLFDADRVPDVRKTGTYVGHTRLGIHKYTAEAQVRVRTHVPVFYVHTSGYVRGYTRPFNDEAIQRVRRGVLASMAVRDTILIDTNITRKVQLRDLVVADGTHVVGQLVEN